MRIFTALAAIMVSTAAFVSNASAEIDYLAEIYGEGVHAFYDGDYVCAQKFFDQAISNGYKDPRCYYFRALLHMKFCRVYEAEQDIKMGARYELEGRGTYDIGRALYRIQGSPRIRFERHRRDAKLELVSSRPVPSQPYSPPPTTVVEPGLPPIAPGLTDPFSDDEDEVEQPVEEDTTEAEVDDEGMFDDQPAADDAEMFDDLPADDGGFDDLDAGATDDAPADDDPFGGTDDDPFGGTEDIFDGF